MEYGRDFKELVTKDVSYLDKTFLNGEGLIQPVSAAFLKDVELNDLLLWAQKHAIYQIVTIELIDWLKEQIDGVRAIEIGAGVNCISRELGITGTDSYIQVNDPIIKAYYDLMQQPVTAPPKDIKKYEAFEAVRTFNPHTVIGSFITQKGSEAENLAGIPCSLHGVNELQLLTKIKRYILFGNKNTHAQKHIFKLPHKELHFDWLYSKGLDQSLNRVWIWGDK